MLYPVFLMTLNLLCGISALILGINFMSEGLKKANTKIIEKVLTLFTKNVLIAFIAGTLITAIVQSSSAVTVMTVGLVNAGLMNLYQAVGIIYGANIGTTMTAQLMSFDLSSVALPALVIGMLLKIISKQKAVQNAGRALLGLGLLFIGLKILQASVPYITQNEKVFSLFQQYGQDPYISLFIGLITTMIVQSSSATIGITIVLFNSRLISLESAIGLTLGDNIGTCITAQLASIGTETSAKRVAWAHTLYNIIGVCFAVLFLKPFSQFVLNITYALGQNDTRLVANTHTLFNSLNALFFLPLTRYFVEFVTRLVPEKRIRVYKRNLHHKTTKNF